MQVLTTKRYKPNNLDILKATNSQNIKEACKKLGVTDGAVAHWKKEGMNRDKAIKYFGEEYIKNLEENHELENN